MSGYGELILYTEVETSDVPNLLRNVSTILRADTVWYTRKTLGQDCSYDTYLASMKRLAGRLIYRASEVKTDFVDVGDDLPIEDAIAHYTPETALRMAYDLHAKIGDDIEAAFKPRIGAEDFGHFAPCDPAVTVGWHDLWREEISTGKTVLLARPFFSLSFDGQGYPVIRSMQHLTDMLMENPVIQDVRRQVEALVGPLEVTVKWSG